MEALGVEGLEREAGAPGVRAPNRSEAWARNAPKVNVGWALRGSVGLGFSLSTLLMFLSDIRGTVFEGDVCLIYKISGLFIDVIVYSILI